MKRTQPSLATTEGQSGPTPTPRPPDDRPEIGPSKEELQLVAQAQQGDPDAFRVLVEQHQDRVFAWLRRLLGCDRDTAADLTQEVFMRAFRGIHEFDARSRFSTWLHKIATNCGISLYRHRRALKRQRWTFSLDAPIAGTDDLRHEPPSRETDPAARAHHHEITVAVEAAISELPDEFREAVLLRDLQGLAYEEIAELLGVPPGTVRSRIHRGRLILQERLRDFQP